MPSVVNISTTQTVKTSSNQFPFQFPPGSPFEEMFKDFQRPTDRQASSLGSGLENQIKKNIDPPSLLELITSYEIYGPIIAFFFLL